MPKLLTLLGVCVFLLTPQAQVQGQQYACEPGHCYATALFGAGCGSPNSTRGCLFGYRFITPIFVKLPGNGLITSELWFSSFESFTWIEVGYGAFYPKEGLYYFVAERRVDGVFTAEYFAVPSEDLYKPTDFGLTRRYSFIFADLFEVFILGNVTNIVRPVLSSAYLPSRVGYATIGQELAGSAGALSRLQGYYPFFPDAAGNWQGEYERGNEKEDAPPYGFYTLRELEEYPGIFVTYCCQGPPGPLTYGEVRAKELQFPFPRRALARKTQMRGIAAIPPRQNGTKTNIDPADIRLYALEASLMKIETSARRSIAEIDCHLSGEDLRRRIRLSRVESERRICYVELRGDFIVSGPPGKQGQPAQISRYSKAFEVFDATTGNLLLTGALP